MPPVMNSVHPHVTLLIPVKNESAGLAQLEAAVTAFLATRGEMMSVLAVDDGSDDESFAQLAAWAGRDGRVRVLRLARNYGGHIAIAAGLAHAEGDAVCIVAADLQDPLAASGGMIDLWRAEGWDAVWGVRAKRDDPAATTWFARAFHTLVKHAGLPQHPDGGTGSFCLLGRRMIDAVNRHGERHRWTPGLVMSLGFRQTTLPYRRVARTAGASNWGWRAKLKLSLDALTALGALPVRLVALGGAGLTLAGLIGGAALGLAALGGAVIGGWGWLAALILLVGGLNLLGMAAIGEYVWRTLDEARRRPLYLVMDRVGFGDGA